MNQTLKTITIGAVVFLTSAALAFWIGSNLATDDVTPEAVMPVFEEPLPVIIPVPFDGDPVVAAETLAEQVNASRTIASEIGVVLEPSSPSGIETAIVVSSTAEETPSDAADETTAATPGQTTITETTPGATAVPETEEGPLPSSGGTPPAEETATDFCVDGGEGCPEGVSGTILALHALPPLAGVPEFRPAPPGSGFSYYSPECPPQELEEGKAYFGVSTNRPAIIAMEYRSDDWAYGRGYTVPWTTFETTTPDGAETAWNEWWADESVTELDRRAWIQHCFTLDDLPAGARYIARFTYTDKFDPSITTSTPGRLVRFSVPGRDALVLGSQRRPTTILPLGMDQLFVGMTREPDQDIAVAAREGADLAMCDIAGDTGSIYSGSSTIRAVVTSDGPIDREVLDDPAYPYLAEHTQSVVTRLDLREGTDYVVCVYWLAEGPSFDPVIVEIAESIPVSTPEAYRPTIVLHGLTNLFGEIDLVQVRIPGCGTRDYDLADPSTTVRDRADILSTPGPQIELCTLTQGLAEIDRRGIRVETRVVATGASSSESGGAYIRTDFECRTATCLFRLPEMALVPLPLIPADDSDCGSGFGVGCLSDGMRSAGDVIIEIQFDATAGSGISSWGIGEAAEFDDTTPPLAENPQISVETEVALSGGHPLFGAMASVTVVADRPVTLRVEVSDVVTLEEPCSLGPIDGYNSTTLSTTHTFTLDPLCLGQKYMLAITATDESGDVATILGRRPWVPEGLVELYVPPVSVTTEMSAIITAPDDDHRHRVEMGRVVARSDDVITGGPFAFYLSWIADPEAVAAAERSGWRMPGTFACGSPGAGPLEYHGRSRPGGVALQRNTYATQNGLHITVPVDIYRILPIGGAIVGDCVPGALVEGVLLSADISLEELFDGVTITSESGSVVFTIRATRFRSELIG
jgi:hypothetical protein